MTTPFYYSDFVFLANFILSELFGVVIFNFHGVWDRIYFLVFRYFRWYKCNLLHSLILQYLYKVINIISFLVFKKGYKSLFTLISLILSHFSITLLLLTTYFLWSRIMDSVCLERLIIMS